MNYLTEIREFYNWLERNQASASTISLWYALMHIANKTGWQEWFSSPIATLELKSGLSRSAIYRARNALRQMERIDFKERGGKSCALYKIIPFVSQIDTQSGTLTGTQSGTQTEHLPEHKAEPLNKPNKTKPSQTNIPPLSPQGEKHDPLEGFSPPLREAMRKWLAYKKERRESYKEQGLSTLIKKTQAEAARYGEAAVIDAVETSIANGYQGIVWDRLKQQAYRQPSQQKSGVDRLLDMIESGEFRE